MGAERVTTQSLQIVIADAERGLLLIKGSVPGSEKGWVLIKDAVKRRAPEGCPSRRRCAATKSMRRRRRRRDADGRHRGERAMKLSVRNLDNQEVGDIELADAVFGLPVRGDILARVVAWQLAKRRAGTHKTKGVSEISGTSKSPTSKRHRAGAPGSLRSPNSRRRGDFRAGRAQPRLRSAEKGAPARLKTRCPRSRPRASWSSSTPPSSTRPRPRRCGRGSRRSAGSRC